MGVELTPIKIIWADLEGNQIAGLALAGHASTNTKASNPLSKSYARCMPRMP